MTVESVNADITIVGAGMIGCALALELARERNIQIVLVERGSALIAPDLANERVVALGAPAKRILMRAGVFEKLGSKHCHPYHQMTVWEEASTAELSFSAQEVDAAELGHMVDAQACTYLLQMACRDKDNICLINEAKPVAIDQSDNDIRLLCDGQNIRSGLLIGADGARSWVRRQARIFSNQHSYQQLGIVATIETEFSHEDCAWQRFLSSGPVAVLPLANNQSSIVWSCDLSLADTLLNLPEEQFCDQLMQALDGRLGQIKLLSKRLSFPLLSQKAQSYFKRRVVLVGDAAHSIHPMAGQGANLGFKDIECLCRNLKGFAEAQILSALKHYEQVRKLDNNQTDALMTALHLIFREQSFLLSGFRSMGLRWINQSSGLRHILAEHAIGK